MIALSVSLGRSVERPAEAKGALRGAQSERSDGRRGGRTARPPPRLVRAPPGVEPASAPLPQPRLRPRALRAHLPGAHVSLLLLFGLRSVVNSDSL
jgi:hypothetical protein